MEVRGVSGNVRQSLARGEKPKIVQMADEPVHVQVLLHEGASMLHAKADFPGPDEVKDDPRLKGTGRLTIWEDNGSHLEIFGTVGDLASILTDAASAFRAEQDRLLRRAAREVMDEEKGGEGRT